MESPKSALLVGAQTDHDSSKHTGLDLSDERVTKRVKLSPDVEDQEAASDPKPRERMKGVAMVKEEYLIKVGQQEKVTNGNSGQAVIDDDAAEGRTDDRDAGGKAHDSHNGGGGKKNRKQKGQNKERDFGRSADSIALCNSRVWTPEFSPRECKYGDHCKNLHDLRKYLEEGRRGDLTTLNGICPVWEAYGKCPSGWRCRFVGSHMKEVEREDGRKELVLVESSSQNRTPDDEEGDARPGVVNAISFRNKVELSRRKVNFEKSDEYLAWLTKDLDMANKHYHKEKDGSDEVQDYRSQYVEPPVKPSEKRRIYFGRETPVLAPLTTQGNLPFRRLCVELGAQTVYSEMALSLPLLQGAKSEWALMKAHESETRPPRYNPDRTTVHDYDNSKDLKFGAQIAANAYWVAIKATEALTKFLPHLRLIDLNCGCPIDMLYKSGSGSALLDAPSKLDRMVRGMGAVSGNVPITAKIRMGVKDDKPTAQKLIERLALGPMDMRDCIGSSGCAAITLHGRSRQQRYTRSADWGYIAECAAMIKSFRERKDEVTDTIREPEENTLPNGGRLYFLGNGDCFSHVDYFDHVDNARVDSVMIGRGAIIKPWIFEEIEKGQYLDKSASERLSYVEKYARYGLEAWGSDELGVGLTRRFLLDFLSFYHRYVPIGLLEHLPPSINERAPKYRGRNDLETLLASDNCADWMKISEMFLGPAHPDFKFLPKHKANSYEIEAEG